MEACEDLRPQGGGNFSEEDQQEMQDAAGDAQCMRENGVPDFPDPEFSGDDSAPGSRSRASIRRARRSSRRKRPAKT